MRTSVVLVSAVVFGGFAGTHLLTSPSVAAVSAQLPPELVELGARLEDIQRRLNEHDQYLNNIGQRLQQPDATPADVQSRLDDIQRRLVDHDQYFNNIDRALQRLGPVPQDGTTLEARLSCLENGGRLYGLSCVTAQSQEDLQMMLSRLDRRLSCLEAGGKLNTLGSCEMP